MTRSPAALAVDIDLPRVPPKVSRARLYRRATQLPSVLTRPAVVRSRTTSIVRGKHGVALYPSPCRPWLVIAPYRIPGRAPLILGLDVTVARCETHAEAVALATAAARQHADTTGGTP